MVARNVTRATVLATDLEVAAGLWGKFKGLMGRASLAPGSALWLPDSNGIHMMFMRFPIDAVFVGRPDAAGTVGGPSSPCIAGCAPGPGSCRSCAAHTASWSCRWGRSRPPRPRSGTAVLGHRRHKPACSVPARWLVSLVRGSPVPGPRSRVSRLVRRLRSRGAPDLRRLPPGARRATRAAGGDPDRPAGRPAAGAPPGRVVRAVRWGRPRRPAPTQVRRRATTGGPTRGGDRTTLGHGRRRRRPAGAGAGPSRP